MIRFFRQKTVKVGIYYPLSLFLAALACFWLIGERDILTAAMTSRPYAILLGDYYYSGLLREHHEKNLIDEGPLKKVLLLGDSAVFYPPDPVIPRDRNSRIHLSAMIQDSIIARGGGANLKMSDWSYIGATLLDRYCFFYQARKYRPDLIIISIHWRSFGAPWQDNPDFFRPELSALAPLRSELPEDYTDPFDSAGITTMKRLEHKLSIYSLYPVGARNYIREWLGNTLGGDPGLDDSKNHLETEEVTPQELPEILTEGAPAKRPESPILYSRSYPMSIEPSHPALSNIRAISYVASKHKIKTLFYLWPVDLEYFKEIGIHNQSEFEKSRRLIREAARGDTVFFVDLSTLLGHEYVFDWQGHFTVEGRRKIAEALTPKIVEILELEISEPEPLEEYGASRKAPSRSSPLESSPQLPIHQL